MWLFDLSVQNCLHDTTGDYCEQCAPGFYGIATRGSPYDCVPCACPLTEPSNKSVVFVCFFVFVYSVSLGVFLYVCVCMCGCMHLRHVWVRSCWIDSVSVITSNVYLYFHSFWSILRAVVCPASGFTLFFCFIYRGFRTRMMCLKHVI